MAMQIVGCKLDSEKETKIKLEYFYLLCKSVATNVLFCYENQAKKMCVFCCQRSKHLHILPRTFLEEI